jgi:hypothetical protein
MRILPNRVLQGSRDRVADWTLQTSRCELKGSGELVLPTEVAANAEVAIAVRQALLRRAYGAWPESNSAEFLSDCMRLREARDHICFWGDPEATSQLGSWLSGKESPSASALDRIQLGTLTIRNATDTFGPLHFELMRAASLSTKVPATDAILLQIVEHFSSRHKSQLVIYSSVVRNRESTPLLRGGAAIHMLHTKHLNSDFLGIVPWLHPADGTVEVADYREMYMGNETDRLRKPVLNIEYPDEAEFCKTIVESVPRLARCSIQQSSEGSPALLSKPRISWRSGHTMIHLESGHYDAIEECLDSLNRNDSDRPLIAVSSLEDTGNGRLQKMLRSQEFFLSAIIPGSLTNAGKQKYDEFSVRGIWSHIPKSVSLAEPMYLKRGMAAKEQKIRECVIKTILLWQGTASR